MEEPRPFIEEVVVSCPYCGEALELLVDNSGGDQDYTEDCQVCCQPMVVRVMFSETGEPQVEAFREDDTF